jgi:hypothetical protein
MRNETKSYVVGQEASKAVTDTMIKKKEIAGIEPGTSRHKAALQPPQAR